MDISNIKIIGLDADDTLWDNEVYFRQTEKKFCELLNSYASKEEVEELLFLTESKNMPLYGYGIKAFTLSMMETALKISNYQLPGDMMHAILEFGREQLKHPLSLLPGVKDTLEKLACQYKVILATKGDLLDQERKLELSGLSSFFHHVEIMSDKKIANYKGLLSHIDVSPEEFLMIGNSLRSDILPPLALGSKAIYIPYVTTWVHEEAKEPIGEKNYLKMDSLCQIPDLFKIDVCVNMQV